ncbi:MAG: CCA tRNA nucleotidyltransferase [Planctomycetaceae bacterium]|nr:CCA tRNA nucleotidyltransferase [Planctomycetales bacterium]MCB9875761.1 CCA tRNA nucleotidyltransferase [Planctomycetaceae bacterium]MCB9936898.1 CCA tRNA nucleotidyltransferase [Planctomycetaceae bacterium]HRX79702.1 CCA tRNA nucleotidyltransferase [Pirellulaceae bacterium]
MASIDPTKAREFAKEVVAKLRESGFQALWAGGCVRDQLLGCEPKDYDVATSATPTQIREVFGKRRTLAIGAAFGVITVIGPRVAGQVEVATFRRDATYSDGRHPDSVAFSNAAEDASRRDFTINGLFYDPLSNEVIDYVGGQDDLKKRLVRAIGDAEERLSEDKLRMLRAVRFATTLGFDVDPETMAAVQRHADELKVVSVERITAELRRLLQHPNRRRGVELLRRSGLLEQVLPALDREGEAWEQTLDTLEVQQELSFPVAAALLFRTLQFASASQAAAGELCRRWKLSNEEIEGVLLCLNQEMAIRNAPAIDWPQLQRVLIHPRVEELMSYCKAVCQVIDGSDAAIQFCRVILNRPRLEWNPAPLITGNDLARMGIPAGPAYRELLTAVRDAQLKGELPDQASALAFVQSQWKGGLSKS